MDNNFKNLLDEFSEAKEQYAKDHELPSLIEETMKLTSDDLIDGLISLLPKISRSSYTLDRDIINVIDFISDRLKGTGISTNRSKIVNMLLDLIKNNYENGESGAPDQKLFYKVQIINKNYFKKYFEITKGEVNQEKINNFGFVNDMSKDGISLEIRKDNTLFLDELVENNGVLKKSNVLNIILAALLLKKNRLK